MDSDGMILLFVIFIVSLASLALYLEFRKEPVKKEESKKTLKISGVLIKSIVKGFLFSFVIIIIIQHFGEVFGRMFHSPLGYDYEYITPLVNNTYPIRLSIYVAATLSGFHYLLLFGVILSAIFYISKRIKIKIT